MLLLKTSRLRKKAKSPDFERSIFFMKKFFETYGGIALGTLAILVLVAMVTPVGNIIKTGLQGTVSKFYISMKGQVDTAMVGAKEAQNSANDSDMNFAEPDETPVVPDTPEPIPEPTPEPAPTPTPTPEPEAPVTPPVEIITPENYDGYITEPGKYFINALCINQDQKPGGAIPMPYCLNYEINVFVGKKNAVTGEYESSEKTINYTEYQGYDLSASKTTNYTKKLGSWTGWRDTGKPSFDKTGGDSEMITFGITQEMLDEANGKIFLDWSVRAAMYPSVPVQELGQFVGERVGKIESDGSQIILGCYAKTGSSICS